MPIDTRFYEAGFDGSSIVHSQRSGVGGWIVSPDGILTEYSEAISYLQCPFRLEYTAIIHIMRHLDNLGARNVFIYGDSKWVIEKLHRKTTKHLRLVEEDIKLLHTEALDLLRRFAYYRIQWISRESNQKAHDLCRLATRGERHGRSEDYIRQAKVGHITN